MLELPQVDCPLIHRFAPGVYLRTITMPAGSLIVGHKHLTKHGNVVLRGSALVSIAGKIQEIKAPHVFISDVGVRKVLYIKEEMEWMTIHPSESQNLDELELQLIEKSDTFNAHKAALELAENVAKTPREVLK